MKTTTVTALVLLMSFAITPATSFAADEILTPTEEGTGDDFGLGDEFGDLFGDDFGEEFSEESESSEEESTGEENETTEEDTEKETKEVGGVDEINKKSIALYDRVPGAVQAKGMTFLSFSSAKTRSKYLPCDTEESQTLMNRFTRVKLSQGAPLTCREDITFRLMPYRMYRRTR